MPDVISCWVLSAPIGDTARVETMSVPGAVTVGSSRHAKFWPSIENVPPTPLRPRDDDGASTPALSALATEITQGAFLYLPVMVPEPEPELPAENTTTMLRSTQRLVAMVMGSRGSTSVPMSLVVPNELVITRML